MDFIRRQAAGIAAGVALSAVALVAAGLAFQPLGIFERGKKTVDNYLDPGMAAHDAIDLWHGDRARFSCPKCPTGSQFRITSVELMRDKIVRKLDDVLDDLGSGTTYDKVKEIKELVAELPPRGQNAPKMPFDGWDLPTNYVDKGEYIDTTSLPKAKFKPLKSSQFYSVTWTVKKDSQETEYDPHIYAHGGKRR